MKEPKPIGARLQSAITNLRAEDVPEGAKGRAFDAMVTPKPGRLRIPAFATAGAAVVAIVALLVPSRKAMGWQEVVQNTLGTTRLHCTEFSRVTQGGEWTNRSDQWIDGKKEAMRASLEIPARIKNQKKFVMDIRFDGRRRYALSWNGYGIVRNSTNGSPVDDFAKRYSLQWLLSNTRIKLEKGPEETQLNGVDVLRYEAKAYEGPISLGYSNKLKFYAEKDGGRLLRMEYYDRKGEMFQYSTIEYPTYIPPQTFTPPTSGRKIIDLDEDGQKVMQCMVNGVPFGKGNVLRAVIQSPTNELVVLWTGAPPNGDASEHPTVVGQPFQGARGPDILTASRWKMPAKTYYRLNGELLSGISLQVGKPVHGTVTLKMPILVENKNSPIKDGKGVVRGYRSKRVGATVVKNFPVIETIPFSVLNHEKSQHKL